MRRLLFSILVALAIATSSESVHAQQPSAPAAPTGSWVIGGQLYVVVPADRRSILAFSTATATLSRLALDAPLPDGAEPVVASKVAAIQVGRTVYAIGATGDRWVRLDLPVDGLQFTVGAESIRVSNDDVFYVFASGSTQWEGVDLHNGAMLSSGNSK